VSRISTLKDMDRAAQRGLASLFPKKTKIMVGMATSGIASGAQGGYDL